VVDGTVPYSRDFEAEMEILRWTGRPRMALVNRIGTGNHIEEWKKALGQYFSLVREFDANRASFDDRIRLLESFRELDRSRGPRSTARSSPRARAGAAPPRGGARDRRAGDRRSRSGRAGAQAGRAGAGPPRRGAGEAAGPAAGRGAARPRQIFELYRFRRLKSSELKFDGLKEDLFAEKTWEVLGLTHGQL
jgi:hypothetical protein